MDTTVAPPRNRLLSSTTSATMNSESSSVAVITANTSSNPVHLSASQNIIHTSPAERISTTSSFANLLDGFIPSRSSVERQSQSAASTPSSSISSTGGPVVGVGIGTAGSIASLTSIGSLGTTANAFYSSIGLAFNSLTSPITAAAAAATATTAEAAAVVVAAASAISNHLSSPTSGTPPSMDDFDNDEQDGLDDEEHANAAVPEPTPKKSWSEIKSTVNLLRLQLSTLSSMVPTNIQFRTLSDGRVRCYFLITPPDSWEMTLLYTDINPVEQASSEDTAMNSMSIDAKYAIGEEWRSNSGGSRIGSPTTSQPASPTSGTGFINKLFSKRLQWHALLQQPTVTAAAAAAAASGINAWSREYQLLQERKRLSTWGITSYELHKTSGKIVFPCISELYQCLDTGYHSGTLFPTQLRTHRQWAALDPQICPKNSDLVAYISGCDIWVTHTLSGHEERLTFAHDGGRSFAEDPLSAGVPSYVMQEEFSRFQGYWWQPTSNDDYYRIVYEEVDESDVCLYTFPSSQALAGEIEEYRFPRTGTHNAKSKLKIVQFALNESLQISNVTIFDLPYSLSVVLPWLEYIVRVGWTPGAEYVWFQGMNRKQQRLDLVLIPLDNFCENYETRRASASQISPLQIIYTQSSEAWININDLLYFLELTPTRVTFLWGSEETGYRHLYLVTSSLSEASTVTIVNGSRETTPESGQNSAKRVATATSNVEAQASSMNTSTLSPRIINKVALTSGDWEVLGRNIWVDKEQQLVYFLGLRDTPLEKHLYVVSLQRPEHVRLLTETGYSHAVEFDENCRLALLVYCNIRRLPSSKVMRIEQSCLSGGVNGIQMSLIGYLHEGCRAEAQYCPQIFEPQLPSGDIVYAMVFKPHNFQLGVKYPTVLNVYGGPEVQTVNNTFKGKHQLRMHMLAAQGYCVVCIDSRGSQHRGHKFENHIRCRMGTVELHDQVDALRILADQLGYIDMNRVAIHGWSYGGYLSLMGLVQFPEVFKIAIAGAPVTNWEYYDTGYTERYMDLPQNNKRGYTAGSVLNYIHLFPEEENRLLLIHGLIDENVHFYHTSQLITALNKANKPYNLHIFPGERHSLRNLESNKNYETKLLSFLQNL